MRWIVEAAPGRGVCVIETRDVTQRRFCDLDAACAAEEGERSLSLAWRRRDHAQCFWEEGIFAPDMLAWCGLFLVVEIFGRGVCRPGPGVHRGGNRWGCG